MTSGEERHDDAHGDSGGVPDEMSAYVKVFVEETGEEVEALVDALLTLESEPGNSAALNEAFRLVHSMKGSAGMMGYGNVSELAHRWEDLLDAFRTGRDKIGPPHVEVMLRCVDAVKSFVEALSQDEKAGDLPDAALAELVAQLAGPPEESNRPATTGQESGALVAASTSLAANSYHMTVRFDPELQLPDLKARLIVSRLANVGEVGDVVPDPTEVERIEAERLVEIRILSGRPERELRSVADVEGVVSVDVEPALPEVPVGAGPRAAEPILRTTDDPGREAGSNTPVAEPGAGTPAPVSTDTIRVEIGRLDRLMNLAGELVVNRERLLDLLGGAAPRFRRRRSGEEFADVVEGVAAWSRGDDSEVEAAERDTTLEKLNEFVVDWDRVGGTVRQLVDAADQLKRVSDDLQRAVMETRMVPLAPLFNRFKRVVRDLSGNIGKKVRLRIRGEKTELDKRMIDELADPLVHLVRNAIDHGLESPAERLAAGKPEEGTITLEAVHRGNNVHIEIRDDGRGLNVDRIRKRIIERGFSGAEEAGLLSERDVVSHIWKPGFSTAETVSDISGRGVGMDVVRNRMGALSGSIDVRSELGHGTTFELRLPLTLAIVPSLMMKIAEGVFSVPLEEVREIVRVEPSQIVTVRGRRVFELRDSFVPLVRVQDTFDWPDASSSPEATSEPATVREVAVLRVGGQSLGIEIDAPLGVSELVIKSLSENFRNVPGLSGASILGDGRVALMLDSLAILERARARRDGGELGQAT